MAAGFSYVTMDAGRVAEYGELVGRAYPPSHPDHERADADPASASGAFARYLSGDQIGPWIAEASLHVTDRAGRVVGLVLVNETRGRAMRSTARSSPIGTSIPPPPATESGGRCSLHPPPGWLTSAGRG